MCDKLRSALGLYGRNHLDVGLYLQVCVGIYLHKAKSF